MVAEVPPPDIRPHEVLVEVAAAALNHADLLMRRGSYVPAGADRVIDTSTTGIADALGAHGYDVCLDHVGGPRFAELMDAAAPLARIVQIGRLAGDRAEIDLELLAARRIRLIGTMLRGRATDELHALVADLRTALLGEHHVRAVVDSVFDLASAEDAAQRLTEPGLTGKVVLRVA